MTCLLSASSPAGEGSPGTMGRMEGLGLPALSVVDRRAGASEGDITGSSVVALLYTTPAH